MTQFKGVSGGRLNVGVISAGDYFFPRLLVEFASRHRGVTLNFTVHNREGLLRHIADNLTDLAIMVRPPADRHRQRSRSRRTPTSSSRAGPSARRREADPAGDAMREPFVVREKGSDTWNSMEEGFGEHSRTCGSRWRSPAPRRSSRR